MIVQDSTAAWFVAVGNLVIGIITLGFFRCTPVYFHPWMYDFDVNYSDVTSISGLFCFGVGTGCLVLPFLTKKLGYRVITISSGLLYSTSYVIAAFAEEFILMQIFAGFFAGFLCGILFFTSLITCGLYFLKHRSLATGIATGGIPIGTISLSPLTSYLVDQFGWRGALFIQSGILLNACVAGALYLPITKAEISSSEPKSVNKNPQIKDEQLSSLINRPIRKPLKRQQSIQIAWKHVKGFGDLSIFSSLTYDVALLSSIFYMCGYIGANTFLMPFAHDHLGVSNMEAALTLTIISASEIPSRVFTGAIGDKKFINRSLLLVVTSFIFGIIVFAITFCRSYKVMMTLCVFYGLVSCTYQSIIPVVYGDIVGKARLPQALGYQGFIYNMLLAPCLWLNGYLLDKTHNFRMPFYLCSAMIIISSVCMQIIWIRIKRK